MDEHFIFVEFYQGLEDAADNEGEDGVRHWTELAYQLPVWDLGFRVLGSGIGPSLRTSSLFGV